MIYFKIIFYNIVYFLYGVFLILLNYIYNQKAKTTYARLNFAFCLRSYKNKASFSNCYKEFQFKKHMSGGLYRSIING